MKPTDPSRRLYRHRLPVRVMHWINVICLTILLMSGLQIFNAHPALYWGKSSYTGRPPVLLIGARESGESGMAGFTRIFGTGALGPVLVTMLAISLITAAFARRARQGAPVEAAGA